jgi:hypothetical protein
MYPDRELSRLAVHKIALRQRIAFNRLECVEAAGRMARPFAWLDRVLAFWRKFSPQAQVAAVPLGIFLARTVFPKMKLLGALMRWGPLAFGIMRRVADVFRKNEGT